MMNTMPLLRKTSPTIPDTGHELYKVRSFPPYLRWVYFLYFSPLKKNCHCQHHFAVAVLSKNPEAHVNEMLAKTLCYNIRALKDSMSKLDIIPSFGNSWALRIESASTSERTPGNRTPD